MGEAAVRVARAAGYYNAGTVEFLVDEDANFYFLEMNTRLQVEHPVTELATGLDLVELQLAVAAGEPLPLRQEDVRWNGWAVECRLYAEDPERNFFPSPGLITRYDTPSGPGLRLDSGVFAGWTVPLDYDPMLAKLAAYGSTRAQAAGRLREAISRFHIGGIQTNLSFFHEVLGDPEFLAGNLHTGFLDEFFARRSKPAAAPPEQLAAALAAALASRPAETPPPPAANGASRWVAANRSQLYR